MEVKDLSLNMPCSDPEGCKHFKAEIKLQERIKKLEAELQELANQMMERYESWDGPEKGTLLGWHQRIERALRKGK